MFLYTNFCSSLPTIRHPHRPEFMDRPKRYPQLVSLNIPNYFMISMSRIFRARSRSSHGQASLARFQDPEDHDRLDVSLLQVPSASGRLPAHHRLPFTEWKCNLDCHYCWSYDNRVKGMTEDTARRAIDWLHTTPCRVLAPTGGEPLLRPRFCTQSRVLRRKEDYSGFTLPLTRAFCGRK